PFFQGEPFLVVNGDVWCDWDFKRAAMLADRLDAQTLAWLLMVDNPPHHPAGDFALAPGGRVAPGGEHTLTFSGIGLYRPEMFSGVPIDRPTPLGPLLRHMVVEGRVAGARHGG